MKKNAEPKVLYHYTCLFHLPAILQARFLTLTDSNFSFAKAGMFPVVWLTDSPTPNNMGLLFDTNIPDEFNKTYIRFTIKKKPYMKQWDEWSNIKGMDKHQKEILIRTASAEDTYRGWYISESIIPINDILCIENLAAGTIIYQRDTAKAQ